MRQPQGFLEVNGPGAGAGEWDTFTCAHCNTLHRVKPMAKGDDCPDVCHLCGDKHRPSFICKNCLGKGCAPFEKQLELMERRARFRAELVG